MEEPGSAKRSKRQFKSFSELQRSLEETGEDLETLIYPSLKFGAFYHIPDMDSGFGEDGTKDHPWVLITSFEAQHPTIIACPRTSTRSQPRGKREFGMPGGILPELERDAVVILNIQRPFPAKNFRYYKFIGHLPDAWQNKLRDALQKIARESEAP